MDEWLSITPEFVREARLALAYLGAEAALNKLPHNPNDMPEWHKKEIARFEQVNADLKLLAQFITLVEGIQANSSCAESGT